MNCLKAAALVWSALAALLLALTLAGFDGRPNSDIAVVLIWGMLLLSAPSGALVPLVHACLYGAFGISVSTTDFSLTLDWLAFAVLGYWQWFKFLPWLLRRLAALGVPASK